MRTLQGYNCVATPDTSVLGALTSTIWAKIYIYHLYVGYDLHVNIITKSTTDRKKVNVRGAQCVRMSVRATQERWPRSSWGKRSGARCVVRGARCVVHYKRDSINVRCLIFRGRCKTQTTVPRAHVYSIRYKEASKHHGKGAARGKTMQGKKKKTCRKEERLRGESKENSTVLGVISRKAVCQAVRAVCVRGRARLCVRRTFNLSSATIPPTSITE